MKASKSTITRAVDQPAAGTRFYLFHGPDEGQSRALAARLLESLRATKFVIAGGAVKSDPAALVDEASAMSLFGGNRAIWIEPATKDIEEGVAALLAAAVVESPVVAIGGPLTKTSPLLKLAEASPLALAFASYPPEGQDAERMVIDLGRRFGLKVSSPSLRGSPTAAATIRQLRPRSCRSLRFTLAPRPKPPATSTMTRSTPLGLKVRGAIFSGLRTWRSEESLMSSPMSWRGFRAAAVKRCRS